MGIRLLVLGELDLRGPDQTELHSVLAQPKRLALLTYLAVATPRGFHRRDSLVALLWPDQDADHARAALRQLLYGLRRSLGEGALLTRGDDVALDTSAFECDVWAFEEAAERGDAEAAVGLHRGPFMSGFFLSEAPEFEPWVESERARLDRTYAAMLERVAEEASSRDPAHAVECWRRLAEHDPYCSRIALRLMQALEAEGDGPAAIRHAEQHAALLRAELDAEPDPEVSALADRLRRRPAGPAALVPEEVGTAVEKAQAHGPAGASNSGVEFAGALMNPGSNLPALAAAAGPPPSRARAAIWARLGPFLAAAVVVVTGLALWGSLRSREPQPAARYNLAFPPGQEYVDTYFQGFDVAPGGAAIVYAGPGKGAPRLWVKEKGQLESRPLPGTEGANFLSVSPDAKEVVFNVGTQLRKVSLQGGAPVTLADSGICATWMEDGTLVYQTRYHLRRMPASGGAFEELWPEQPENRLADYPAALPDSKGVLFTLCDSTCVKVMDIWVLDLRSRQARQLITGAVQAWYLDPGYVVFIRRDGAVFALPFDVGALQPSGAAVPLLEGVKVDRGLFPDMALKPDGTLLALLGNGSVAVNREMVWVSQTGEVKQVDPGWSFASARNQGWALSPDARRLAIGLNTDEGDDIWIKELDDGPLVRLTYDPAEDALPAWTQDGRSVYFSSRQGIELRIQQADGSGSSRPLVAGSRKIWQADLTPDGTWLVARVGGLSSAVGARDIVGYRLDQDTTEVPLLVSDYDEVSPQISPDGRWLAYASQETGELEIYVRPFPDVNAGKWAVSRGGGFGPRWAHSGRELLYVSPDSVLMVATVQGGESFHVSDRRALFELPEGFIANARGFPFDITPDDQRFIMQRTVDPVGATVTPRMVLIENWGEEVKAKIRAQRR